MNEEELKEKLEKLERYEAQERTRARWQPYRELEDRITHMENCKRRLEKAAIYQDEASEISSDFDLYLTTHGTADIWDALADFEAQLEAKEQECEALYLQIVTLEEEE